MHFHRRRSVLTLPCLSLLCVALAGGPLGTPAIAPAAVASKSSATSASSPSSGGSDSLEQAAKRAGDTGRKVAMYLIGLAFAFAAVLLVFKRDFREAATIFGVGILAVLLATPSGLETLRSTVDTLFR
jgi:hypothetical protein